MSKSANIMVLEELLQQLPTPHQERAGLIRAIEVLRVYGSQEVVRQALAAAYVAVYRSLDKDRPSDGELSDVQSRLAVALRAVGSSGAEALGMPQP
jgi:hypothetical protein